MPDPLVIGVDSQSAGLGWGIHSTREHGFIKLPKYNGKWPVRRQLQRLVFLHGVAAHEPFHRPNVVVYVEKAMGTSRGGQTTQMMLLGTFVAALADADIPVFMINTSTWKLQVFGKGNGEFWGKGAKEAIHAWVLENLGVDAPSEHEADALAISLAGWRRQVGGLDTWA